MSNNGTQSPGRDKGDRDKSSDTTHAGTVQYTCTEGPSPVSSSVTVSVPLPPAHTSQPLTSPIDTVQS